VEEVFLQPGAYLLPAFGVVLYRRTCHHHNYPLYNQSLLHKDHSAAFFEVACPQSHCYDPRTHLVDETSVRFEVEHIFVVEEVAEKPEVGQVGFEEPFGNLTVAKNQEQGEA